MANTTDVAANAAITPTEAELEKAQAFSREPILLEGETLADLEPGTARRRALDDALAEIEAGHEDPSTEWRRQYSLMLGLERVLEMEPPTLLDGAELNDHQVDALSGTLAALVTEIEEGPQGTERQRQRLERRRRALRRRQRPRTAPAEDEEDLDDELEPDEEPQDWADEPSEDDEEVVAEAPEDPGRVAALLVRARDRRRQDRRGSRLRRSRRAPAAS